MLEKSTTEAVSCEGVKSIALSFSMQWEPGIRTTSMYIHVVVKIIYANSGVLEKIRAEAKCLVKVCTV